MDLETIARDATLLALGGEIANLTTRYIDRWQQLSGERASEERILQLIIASARRLEADQLAERRARPVVDLNTERVARGLAPPPPVDPTTEYQVTTTLHASAVAELRQIAAALHGTFDNDALAKVVREATQRGIRDMLAELPAP